MMEKTYFGTVDIIVFIGMLHHRKTTNLAEENRQDCNLQFSLINIKLK